MFDDLKDHFPPDATEVHVVTVISRAHGIRRRQRVAMLSTSAALAVGIGAIALIPRVGGNATLEAAESSDTVAVSLATVAVAPSLTPASPSTLLPGDDVPAATEAAVPDTGPTAEDYQRLEAAILAEREAERLRQEALKAANATTVPAATTVLESTTVARTAAPIPSPSAPAPDRIVAVDAAGDLLLLDGAGGTVDMLVDWPDLSADPTVEGAVTTTLQAGGLSADGQTAFYSECCEPASGVARRVGVGDKVPGEIGLGVDPQPDGGGSQAIVVGGGVVNVLRVDGSAASLNPAGGTRPVDAGWVGDGRVGVTSSSDGGWRFEILDASLSSTAVSLSIPAELAPDGSTIEVVGRQPGGQGAILAARPRSGGGAGVLLLADPNANSVIKVMDLPTRYRSMAADRSGNWILTVDTNGTMAVLGLADGSVRALPGVWSSAAW